jgi:hypothetical protein
LFPFTFEVPYWRCFIGSVHPLSSLNTRLISCTCGNRTSYASQLIPPLCLTYFPLAHPFYPANLNRQLADVAYTLTMFYLPFVTLAQSLFPTTCFHFSALFDESRGSWFASGAPSLVRAPRAVSLSSTLPESESSIYARRKDDRTNGKSERPPDCCMSTGFIPKFFLIILQMIVDGFLQLVVSVLILIVCQHSRATATIRSSEVRTLRRKGWYIHKVRRIHIRNFQKKTERTRLSYR